MTDWVIGVDVGGTFTDFSARNKKDHHIQVHKRPSTPDDPSRAILEGLRELLDIADIDGAEIARIAHGTTVATNALLQRRGAEIGVVTTKGFRDLLEIGRQVRPKIYDLQTDAPPPLALRQNRLEISERPRRSTPFCSPRSAVIWTNLVVRLVMWHRTQSLEFFSLAAV